MIAKPNSDRISVYIECLQPLDMHGFFLKEYNMAERRMFAKTIIDSDLFLDMPLSAQALYFHLSMRADDDGFVNNPKKIQRIIGASDDDCKLLLAKKFLLSFESGVIVIKHWKIHNYIQKDRYKETLYKDEKNQLELKENNEYTMLDTQCIQNVSMLDTQDRLGKDRLGKDRLEDITPQAAKPIRHKYGMYNNVLLSDDDLEKLKSEFADWEQRIERLSEYIASTGKSYKNHLATIRSWARKEKPDKKVGANGIVISNQKSDLEGVF